MWGVSIMAKINNDTSKHTMSLSAFSEQKNEAASPVRPGDAVDEVVTIASNEGEWFEDDQRKAECGRYGHWEGILDWWEIDESGVLVWSRKEFKGVCSMCGAVRRML